MAANEALVPDRWRQASYLAVAGTALMPVLWVILPDPFGAVLLLALSIGALAGLALALRSTPQPLG